MNQMQLSTFIFIAFMGISHRGFSQPPQAVRPHGPSIDYADPEKYLASGTQSAMTDEEFAEVDRELRLKDIHLSAIKKIYDWKRAQFRNVKGGGKYVGKQTINDILKNRALTGCHDHGLVLVSVLRRYGVPAVFVDATGIDWALRYPDQERSFIGHIFVEVFLDKKWMVFDSTSGAYIRDYDPSNPVIPVTNPAESKGFCVMFKGLDPKDYGVTDIKQLNEEQQRYARTIKEEIRNLKFPTYVIEHL